MLEGHWLEVVHSWEKKESDPRKQMSLGVWWEGERESGIDGRQP